MVAIASGRITDATNFFCMVRRRIEPKSLELITSTKFTRRASATALVVFHLSTDK